MYIDAFIKSRYLCFKSIVRRRKKRRYTAGNANAFETEVPALLMAYYNIIGMQPTLR